MGQRLNIEIVDNDKVLANAYYHWSAYTGSSLSLLREILYKWDEIKAELISPFSDENDNARIMTAVRLLEETGAGLNNSEYDRVRERNMLPGYEFKHALDRNSGLLSITPEGIEETECYEEYRVSVNIESETFQFGVFYTEDKSSFIESRDITGTRELETELGEYPKRSVSFDLCGNIPFDTVDDFCDLHDDTSASYGFTDDDTGYIVGWIA